MKLFHKSAPVQMSVVQDLIDKLPPQAHTDLMEDLATMRPDTDLLEALTLTVSVFNETQLDGLALYAVVEERIAQQYNISLSALQAVQQ